MPPRVFVSYVHDDRAVVGRACDELRAHGVEVWRDVDRLVAGDLWLDRIREQISTCDFFVAFFSAAYSERQRSVMTEELTQAIDEIRRRKGRWFVPILLSGVMPDWYIGRGLTLQSFHWINFSGAPWRDAVAQLLSAIGVNGRSDANPNVPGIRAYLSSVAGKPKTGRHLRLPDPAKEHAIRRALRACRVPHGETVLALIDCHGGVFIWKSETAIVFTTLAIYYASAYLSGRMEYEQCRSYQFSVRTETELGLRPEFSTTQRYICFPDADVLFSSTLFGPSADWVVSVLNGLRDVV